MQKLKNAVMDDRGPSTKRARLSLPLVAVANELDHQQKRNSDVYTLLAERGTKTKALERELSDAVANQKSFEQQLQISKQENEALQVSHVCTRIWTESCISMAYSRVCLLSPKRWRLTLN